MVQPVYNLLKSVIMGWQSQKRRWRTKMIRHRLDHCGQNLVLDDAVHIKSPNQANLGSNIYLGSNFWAQADGGLTIGNNVIISRNCTIHTVNHDIQTPNALPYGTDYIHRPVTIADNVWIGMNVIITPGTTINEGAVIGMGAVVAGSIPALAIAVGNPAQVVGYRNQDVYERLKSEEKWLANIRGVSANHNWKPKAALKQWRAFLQSQVAENGYVTSEALQAEGVEHPSALLYYFALDVPHIKFTQHGPRLYGL